jgi:hypothetical protein
MFPSQNKKGSMTFHVGNLKFALIAAGDWQTRLLKKSGVILIIKGLVSDR